MSEITTVLLSAFEKPMQTEPQCISTKYFRYKTGMNANAQPPGLQSEKQCKNYTDILKNQMMKFYSRHRGMKGLWSVTGLSDKSRQKHKWVIFFVDDKYCKLLTSNHLHPLVYKVLNAYNMYIIYKQTGGMYFHLHQ